MFADDTTEPDRRTVEAFLREERRKSLSEAEWRFRMRGYGYRLRRTEVGVEVARLPRNEVIGLFAL